MESNCNICEFYVAGTGTCKAFPKGIPTNFILQIESHNQVVKGQKGDFVFEIKKPENTK